MEDPIPQAMTVIPRFMTAVHDLATTHTRGEWRSWAEAETAVYHICPPDIMAEVEAYIPGWQKMAGYEDGQTLVHVCSVFVAMLGSDYYRQGTGIERNLWEWVVLLHDLAKAPQKGKRDLTHAFRSAALAARILPTVGFPVQVTDGQAVDAWVGLVTTAVCPTDADPIQDNHQLPTILDGIERLFGRDNAATLILKTILLHHSFSPIPDWPNPATLTEAEVQAFISPALWRLLGPFLAFDSDGWDMYDAATRPLHTAQLGACLAQVERLISSKNLSRDLANRVTFVRRDMRIFVTGATGFAGGHLAEMLLAEGHTVTSLVHAATSRHELAAGVTAVTGDLLDEMAVLTAVAEAQPDVIYHLAGQAYPARSWQMPGQTIAVNTVGTANVLHAAVRWGAARVVVVTSADMYGPIDPEMLPITEQTPPQPRHPYGVSKLAAAQLVPLYWERFGLEVVEARPFNHLGPGQGLGFVAPDFASQIAAIKRGDREKKLLVGNLEALRDFTDVRDVARAYMALAERGVAGETYLIASGRPIPIQEILTTLIELAEFEVQIEEDVARLRPSDTPCLYASYAKLERQTGWQPQIPLRQSLADVLAEWLGDERGTGF